jgi:hypothetical protein
MEDVVRKELVRLLERERDLGSKFVEGVVGNSFAVRGWAITAWGVLLGLAVNKASWEFGLLALVVVAAFAAADLYYSWLYATALDYVRSIEVLTSSYYKSLARESLDPDAGSDLERDLMVFNLGLFSNFPAFRVKNLKRVATRWFFRVTYPALVAIAIAVIILTATSAIGKA